jgi:methionyl aminopeptidase
VGGYCGDSAWTYAVGNVSDEARHLLTSTEAALYRGIEEAVAGARLNAIGHAIEAYAGQQGLGLVREYGGHGIGREMWEDPHVPNHGSADSGPRLRAGMTLAIEPMLNLGGDETLQLNDGWTVITADRTLSAHFEHTILIRDGEPEILTNRVATVVK